MLQLPDEKTLLNFINKEKRHLLAIKEGKGRKIDPLSILAFKTANA
jgi:hypothetical protein